MFGSTPPPPFDPGHLRLGSDLRRGGVEPAEDRTSWHQVRHGVWLPRAVWDSLTPGQRHASLVHASLLRCRPESTHVISGASAAALWGLPRIEDWPSVVVVHAPSGRVSGSDLLRPLAGPEVDPVEVAGVRVTRVPRTIVDLARSGSLVSAVAAADHALRHRLCTANELAAEVATLPPRTRGRTAAALVRDLADPDSMSAGESLSRVQMFRLNLPRPRLQVEHSDGDGLIGLADFGWPGVAGEFDGQVKYRVPEGADPRRAGEVVWAEKRREDRLRRQVRVARWIWAVAMDPPALARVLAEVGVRPTARCTWFDLGRPTA
ncbi:hypothetical protein [Nostocoides sp. Soil756]|jgi:hypothetical protein|uniref:hypothetical protein n=1 Tax=Nostocoides sp. Soil756 TaxID=1736399 RepID=UPI0006F3CBD6|nr:hypothetical protein [Tetrasphaera sp. Soil756]KRE62425.1 hypothetical protein ASG78_05190 [Tetrasphaera sp. Soil756]